MTQTCTTFRHDMRRMSRLVLSDYVPQFAARSYAISVKGTQEQINQDSYLVADHFPAPGRNLRGVRHTMPSIHDPGDALYLIGDGQGAPQLGSRASSLAIEAIEESLCQAWETLDHDQQLAKDGQILNALRAAFDQADHIVGNEADAEAQNMGAEVTALGVHKGKLYLGQVGENQAYLWRAGKLHRLTTHQSTTSTFAKELNTDSSSSATYMDEELCIIGGRRAGTHIKLRVVELEANDYVLLCTKGLTRHVREQVIRSTISATPDAQRICDSLFAEAGKYPIPEDLTMIVVRFALTHG